MINFDQLLLRRSDLTKQLLEIAREISEIDSKTSGEFRRALEGARSRSSRAVGDDIDKAAIEILKRERKPVSTKKLCLFIEVGGRKVPGANPENNLSARLSNNPKFKRLAEGWVLAEWK